MNDEKKIKPIHKLNMSVAIDPVNELVSFYVNDIKSMVLISLRNTYGHGSRLPFWFFQPKNNIPGTLDHKALVFVVSRKGLFDETYDGPDKPTMYRIGEEFAQAMEVYGEKYTNRDWVGFFRDQNIELNLTAFDANNEWTRKAFVIMYGEESLSNLVEPDFKLIGKGFKQEAKFNFYYNRNIARFSTLDPADTKYFNDNFVCNKAGIYLKTNVGD